MQLEESKRVFILKCVIACIALCALAMFVGRQFVPDAPLTTILLYSGLGVLALCLIMGLALICSLDFRQFILSQGGTDAQWLWFGSEPPGLQKLREKKADNADQT